MLNENVTKLLKENMWDLATCLDNEPNVVPILQSICAWSGIFRKSDGDHVLAQCEKCDYNGAEKS